MSSDNCIAILETKSLFDTKESEYRVVHAFGIDNIYGPWCEKNLHYDPNKEAIKEIFKDAKVFRDSQAAFGEAIEISNDIPILEYGIMSIVDFKDYTFKELTS